MESNNELSSQRSIDDCSTASNNNTSAASVYLTASSTTMDTAFFVHKWRINQFTVQQELLPTGDFIESNTFGSYNGDYRFRLKLFPCGKDEECRGYLSLFLQIIRCPSSKLRFRVNFYIDATDGPRGCALNKNIVTINRGGIVTASKFFSNDTLRSRITRFIPDDILTVGVELTVYGEQSNSDEIYEDLYALTEGNHSVPKIHGAQIDDVCSPLGRDLGYLLDTSDFTDFTINVGRNSFKCHKAILAARSPFFQAMFRNSKNQENVMGEVMLTDISSETMNSVLEYIYKDFCSDLARNALEILAAADRFCLDRLKLMCQDCLVRGMNASNVCDRLRVAELFNAHKVKRKALQVFQRFRQSILESREWNELENENPSLAAWILKQIITYPDGTRNPNSTSIRETSPSKRPRIS